MVLDRDKIIEGILRDCFWEYHYTKDDIQKILDGNDFAKKQFLFEKILLNSRDYLNALKIFDKKELEKLIDSYRVPSFNREYAFRRKNIVEVYFLDRELLVEELMWER